MPTDQDISAQANRQLSLMRAAPAGFQVAVDERGHDSAGLRRELLGAADPGVNTVMLCMLLRELSSGDADRVVDALASGQTLTEPVALATGAYAHGCDRCAQHAYLFDGQTVRAAQPCPHPDGLEVCVSIDVPSGRLAIANDLRAPLGVDVGDLDINRSFGVKAAIERAAEHELLFALVGNSCPGVYMSGPDELTVLSPGVDDDRTPILPDGITERDRLCTVMTDLWWVSIADAGQLAARGADLAELDADVVDVTPGRYSMQFCGLRDGFDRDITDAPVIYATIRRVS